jgi:hypothetical protein
MSKFTAVDYEKLIFKFKYNSIDDAITNGEKEVLVDIDDLSRQMDIDDIVENINQYLRKYDYVYENLVKKRIVANINQVVSEGTMNDVMKTTPKYYRVKFEVKKF